MAQHMTEEQTRLVGRTFRHFKGKLYRLEGFAKDSETLEEMVVYRARPLATATRLSRYAPSGNPTPSARANLYGETANAGCGCAPP